MFASSFYNVVLRMCRSLKYRDQFFYFIWFFLSNFLLSQLNPNHNRSVPRFSNLLKSKRLQSNGWKRVSSTKEIKDPPREWQRKTTRLKNEWKKKIFWVLHMSIIITCCCLYLCGPFFRNILFGSISTHDEIEGKCRRKKTNSLSSDEEKWN